MHEIAELTDRQIFDLYYRERDDKGSALPFPDEVLGIERPEEKPEEKPKDYVDDPAKIEQVKEKFYGVGQGFNIPKDVLDAKWQEWLEKNHQRRLSDGD